jgi:hypothetical protein
MLRRIDHEACAGQDRRAFLIFDELRAQLRCFPSGAYDERRVMELFKSKRDKGQICGGRRGSPDDDRIAHLSPIALRYGTIGRTFHAVRFRGKTKRQLDSEMVVRRRHRKPVREHDDFANRLDHAAVEPGLLLLVHAIDLELFAREQIERIDTFVAIGNRLDDARRYPERESRPRMVNPDADEKALTR